MIARLEVHPLASIFPMMSSDEAKALADDLREHGLREPIVLLEGKILDGRNRYEACLGTGTDPTYVEFDGNDPAAFVIARNFIRRHLDESQRGMVLARIAKLPKGVRSDSAIALSTPTQAEAAKLLNVSVDSGKRARVVLDKGAPELVAAVDQGEVAVSAAADFAKRVKKPEQEKLIEEHGTAVAAVKAFREKLPTKKEAEKIALKLRDETGHTHAVLGKDGKYHSGATDAEMAVGDLYLTTAAALRAVVSIKNAAEAVASVSPQSTEIFVGLLNGALKNVVALQIEWSRRHGNDALIGSFRLRSAEIAAALSQMIFAGGANDMQTLK